LSREDEIDFHGFTERHMEDLRRRGNIGRYRRLKVLLGKLKDFAGSPLYFSRLTVRFLHDFETWCLVEKGNKQSTTATNLSDMRAMVNRAYDEGLIAHEENPFNRFTIKQGAPPERTKLSLAEVERVESLDLEKGSLIWHVRNV